MTQPTSKSAPSPQHAEHERLLQGVAAALSTLVPLAAGRGVAPADIRAAIMATDETITTWEVLGALTEIEKRGGAALNPTTARWSLPENS